MKLLEELKHHFFEMADSFGGLKFTGGDVVRFLNGQLSNDVAQLEDGKFQLQARLDRGGRLKAHFYLLKASDQYLAVIPKDYLQELREDLEKYIIMDDVEVENFQIDLKIILSPVEKLDSLLDPDIIKNQFKGHFGFLPCFMTDTKIPSSWTKIKKDRFEEIALIRGEPVVSLSAPKDTLVTDTVVNLSGVSLSKGCFLGQETVSKIETRRGGARFPMLLKFDEEITLTEKDDLLIDGKKAGSVIKTLHLDNGNYCIASLLRNFRIEGKRYSFASGNQSFEATVLKLPLNGEYDQEEYLDQKYTEAVHLFQEDKVKEAMKMFNEIIDINPNHEDALESLGVILGRLERFEEGLGLMDKVLKANPDSVMAHTNKSLFLMRLGKIEEAEEEKAQATVKSFGQFGKKAQAKKEQEEAERKQMAEIDRKMSMFNQVLELDPEDELANYGLADVYFHKNTPEKSLPLLKKVIDGNPKYSVAYLLLGKCFLKLDKNDDAKKTFEKGIEVASAQGDMMPANEMQAKLSSL